jgi:hypothetical protein
VSECTPRKGYLSFESEGAECHFRNVRIKELPTSNPKPEQVAKVDEGFKPLFNHTDLAGLKAEKGAWKVEGGVLKPTDRSLLLSDTNYATGEILFDWKAPAKPDGGVGVSLGGATVMFEPDGTAQVGIAAGGKVVASEKAEAKGLKAGQWNRVVLTFDGKTASATINGVAVGQVETEKPPPASSVIVHPTDKLELRNIYVREVKGKK